MASSEPPLVGFGHGDHVHVAFGLKVEHMPLADQAKADEADADAIIGADHASVTGGGKGRATPAPRSVRRLSVPFSSGLVCTS